MINLRLLFLLLGSLAPLTGASKDLEQMPESWCITYLSTYLIPISVAPSSPGESTLSDLETSVGLETSFSLDRSLSQLDPEPTSSTLSFVPSRDETSLLATVDMTSAPPSATTDAGTDGDLIILRVVADVTESERLRRRDIGGFIGSQSEICDNADIFTLLDGQLLAGGNPVYYNGEGFKALSAQGRTPSGAITHTFTRDGNKLRFQSSRFPTGEAGFCQTPSDGQVYITFFSEPAGCIPVTILVVSFEQCQDGNVVVSTTAASESQQFVSTSFLESVISIPSSSGQGPTTVSTRPDDIITTRSVIPAPIPSSSFMWSNFSSSSQPPKTQRSSSFIPLSTFPSISESSTLAGVVVTTSSQVEATEVSTAETAESTNKSSTQIVELTSITKDITTFTFQTTTLANSQTTTESAAGETIINTTTEGSTTDIPTSTDEESTTNVPTTSSEESTLEIPTTTTLSSALDSTTETTAEAATTTTAEAAPQIGQFGLQGWTSGIRGQC
ncbi:hypothetical protein FAVG1_06901 [Fusarium avenaceum]|nr:hypothetical protein FAVG1_06901 [Fusarium avenaceum]